MSLPYIPGWWDSIDKNALGGFIQGATKAFAPNATAKFEYDQMIKQNPLLTTQLSNLDPTQREAIAKSMGFTDYTQSPLASLSVGPELQDRMELQDFLKTATPEQKEIRLAGKAGTKTNKEISQSDTIFGQTTKSNEQGIRLNDQKLQLNEMELKEKTEMQTLMDTLKIKYPAENINLQKSVMDYVTGKIQTPELQRIVNDPTLGPSFTNLVDLYKERIRLAAQVNIASLRSPQEKLLGISFLQQGVDNALQKINTAKGMIKDQGIYGQMQQTPEYVQATQALQEAEAEHKQLVSAYNSALKTEFGGKYPDVFNPNKIGLGSGVVGPVSPKISQALEMIRSGKGTLEQLMAAPNFTEQEKQAIKMQLGGK